MSNKIRDELPFIEALIVFTKSKVCVEVGVAHGQSTIHICKAAKQVGGFVYGFDVWERHGLNNQFSAYSDLKTVSNKLLSEGLDNFHLIKIDTYKQRELFIDKLKELCSSGIDFAFIDGCHSYRGIKNDFSVIYPLLKKTGIVVFHDTLMIDGCREFVLDLRTKYNDGSFDIVDFPFGQGDRKCGVSILIKRSFPIIDNPIVQVCGSLSIPKEIEERELKWFENELKEKAKFIGDLNIEDDICLENAGNIKRKKFQ